MVYNIAITCGSTNEFNIACNACTLPICTYTVYTENALIGCHGSVSTQGYVALNSTCSTYKIKLNSVANTIAPEAFLRLDPGTYTLRVYQNGIYKQNINVTIGSTQLTNTNMQITTEAVNYAAQNLAYLGGTVKANTIGGEAPYVYTWKRLPSTTIAQHLPIINNLPLPLCGAPIHIYNVTVSDAAGCTKTSSVPLVYYCPPLPTKSELTQQADDEMTLIAAPKTLNKVLVLRSNFSSEFRVQSSEIL